jgi:hypothetical protein
MSVGRLLNVVYALITDGKDKDEVRHIDDLLSGKVKPTPGRNVHGLMGVMRMARS